MGTNYYWNGAPCGACGRSESLHIGKKSAGWDFLFQGYRRDDIKIESWTDWKTFLKSHKGSITDEHNTIVTVNWFFKSIKRWNSNPTNFNHCVEYSGATNKLDDQGNSFLFHEFS